MPRASRRCAADGTGVWPFGAIMPWVGSQSLWHAWGGEAAQALCRASAVLGAASLRSAALSDAGSFTPTLLASGGPYNAWSPLPGEAQIAYGAEGRVAGLLAAADLTGSDGFLQLGRAGRRMVLRCEPERRADLRPRHGSDLRRGGVRRAGQPQLRRRVDHPRSAGDDRAGRAPTGSHARGVHHRLPLGGPAPRRGRVGCAAGRRGRGHPAFDVDRGCQLVRRRIRLGASRRLRPARRRRATTARSSIPSSTGGGASWGPAAMSRSRSTGGALCWAPWTTAGCARPAWSRPRDCCDRSPEPPTAPGDRGRRRRVRRRPAARLPPHPTGRLDGRYTGRGGTAAALYVNADTKPSTTRAVAPGRGWSWTR